MTGYRFTLDQVERAPDWNLQLPSLYSDNSASTFTAPTKVTHDSKDKLVADLVQVWMTFGDIAKVDPELSETLGVHCILGFSSCNAENIPTLDD